MGIGFRAKHRERQGGKLHINQVSTSKVHYITGTIVTKTVPKLKSPLQTRTTTTTPNHPPPSPAPHRPPIPHPRRRQWKPHPRRGGVAVSQPHPPPRQPRRRSSPVAHRPPTPSSMPWSTFNASSSGGY